MVTMGGEGTQAAGGARVMSINVGRTRPLRVADALSVESGIVKRSISNEAKPIAVEVRKLGLAGDEQADPSVHGGLEKAVYLYSSSAPA
jgi:MOSC domain-containing protein YiiM